MTTATVADLGTTTWAGLADARALAARHGNHRVGTQHLLMVLLSGPEDETRRTLRDSGVDQAAVDAALGAILGSGSPPRRLLADHEVDISDRVIAVLADARGRSADGVVTDRDVLVALMEGDDLSVARLIVSSIGVRDRVLERLGRAQRTR